MIEADLTGSRRSCRAEETEPMGDLMQDDGEQVDLSELGDTLGTDVPLVAQGAVQLDQDLGCVGAIHVEIGQLVGQRGGVPPIGRELGAIAVLPFGPGLAQEALAQVSPQDRDLERRRR